MRDHIPKWQLRIKNRDGKQLICTHYFMTEERGKEPHVQLEFGNINFPPAFLSAVTFDSDRQALWYWFRFRDRYPGECEGWFAKPVLFEP